MNLFKDLTPDELEELQRRVGGALLMLPIASGQLGHTTPRSTIQGHYLSFTGQETRVEGIAKRFIIDLFTARTSEVCEKWYGDPTGAAVRRKLRIIAPAQEDAPAAVNAMNGYRVCACGGGTVYWDVTFIDARNVNGSLGYVMGCEAPDLSVLACSQCGASASEFRDLQASLNPDELGGVAIAGLAEAPGFGPR